MPEETFDVVPLSAMRRAISDRMVEAKQTIPHYRLGLDIEVDALLAFRSRINSADNQLRISVNDLLLKAAATALIAVPAMNIQWAGDKILRLSSADIGLVIAVDGGLRVPLVRNAQSKCLGEIAQEVRELTSRGLANKLRMSELVGGSLSISNLGRFGVDAFDAIINPPQCAILAVGAIKPKPVMRNGAFEPVPVMRVTLSLDHRAIDGACGAEFLQVLSGILNDPEELSRQ